MYKYGWKHYIKHYFLKYIFFSPSEMAFYNTLHNILREQYHGKYKIFSKVRLWDIVDVHKDDAESYKYQNQIARRHIDYLLVDKMKNYKPVLAIELNGFSHDNEVSKGKDNYKYNVLKEVGIPLLFFKNGDDKDIIIKSIGNILRTYNT